MTNIAVVLSGCGVFDGSEIHESVLTLLALEENQASYQCFAPNIQQHDVINHQNGEIMDESRNVLIESARISRGEIKNINDLKVEAFDGLIFPGGFGAAKNLSDFALKGKGCTIQPDILKTAQAFIDADKPIGFICISPAMIPQIYEKKIQLTIGNDAKTAEQIEAMGGKHLSCPVEEIIIDKTNKVVSTPAYMLANNLLEAASGIRKLVAQVISLS